MIERRKAAESDKSDIASLLANPDTMGTVIFALVLKFYGEDIFEEDVLEIYARLHDDFGVWLTEEGENRLNAMMLAVSTDAFFEEPEAFKAVVSSLSEGDIPDLLSVTFSDITLPEVMWAIFEVSLCRGDHDLDDGKPLDVGLSPAVMRFVDELMATEADDGEIPSYEEYLEEQKHTLVRQLKEAGFDPGDLPSHRESAVAEHPPVGI